MNTGVKLTPAMDSYLETKGNYPDYIVFYRMGDFYEMFFEDAEKASSILGIVLTKRGKSADQDIPMAGVPAHSSEQYINKLVQNGCKVVICEQLETADEAKKRGIKSIIKREVTRIITPGTVTDDNLLDAKSSNYLMSLIIRKEKSALAWLDISTSKFFF